MNSRSQHHGSQNWILPKEINANGSSETLIGWKSEKPIMSPYGTEWRGRRMAMDSGKTTCPSIGPNEGSAAMDSGCGIAR